jgi:hypothetical protein
MPDGKSFLIFMGQSGFGLRYCSTAFHKPKNQINYEKIIKKIHNTYEAFYGDTGPGIHHCILQ